jgi:hypothetical protein
VVGAGQFAISHFGVDCLIFIARRNMPLGVLPRNVHIYDNSGDVRVVVAGFMQLGLTTTAEFYRCLEICFREPAASNFQLCHADGTVLSRDNAGLIVPLGEYDVISTGITLPLLVLIVI